MQWQCLTSEEVIKKLETDKNNGLNSKSISQRYTKYGKNTLTEKKSKGFLAKFIEQFSDFMVIILLIAAAISFITAIIENSGDYLDPIIILFIVVINAFIGVIQESKAEKAIDALKKLSSPQAKVIRNKKQLHIDSEDVVPGDILVLSTGDLVPADARIIEAHDLKVEESSLTGESVPVEKNSNKTYKSDTPLGDRKNMLFASSVITAGHALGVVVETGMRTQVGKIAHMINEEESKQTPLQVKLAKVGKYLGIGALSICFLIFILGIIQKVPPLDMFMIAISLAVAAIPEGLPAIVTIVLAIGVRRMAANRAIIRKLPAVETLGSASVICSDKTGTLTQNKMTVTELRSANGKISLSSNDGSTILSYAALCNNSTLTGHNGNWDAQGEPTEKALVIASAKSGKVKNALEALFPRVGEVAFDSTRKLMTTVHKIGTNRYRVITKGAPDVLLRLCNSYQLPSGGVGAINYETLKKIERQNEDMASNALRVISVAYRDIQQLPANLKELEKDLTFCGLIGMIDPPRPQAKQAVKDCLSAGIKPVMITGDHIITAKAIAKDLGIMGPNDRAISGNELDKTNQKDLEKNIFNYSVFARVSPEHKVRIVKAFQSHGGVVAMTGDGVNDAPALKVADIGCAMGISGTDVAKGAADMIMTDDNFSTIVEAVKQGRGVFDNIKKTVHFLLSSNVGEIITVLCAFLMRLPTPLLAIQLLWVNLVTDSLPALALGVEPIDKDIMKRKPVSAKSSLFSNGMGYNIIIEGCFIGAISLLAFTIGRVFFDYGQVPLVGRTMAFAVLSLSQLVHAFNVRSDKSILKTGVFGNIKMIYSFIICIILQVSVISVSFLSDIFKTSNLNMLQWIIVSALSLSPLIIVEIEKLISSLKLKNNK